jgi:hypothetical protein
MGAKTKEISRETLKAAAVPATKWRPVTDAESGEAIEALSALVGKKARQPSMVRRLGRLKDGGAFVLAIDVPTACFPQNWVPYEGAPGSHAVAFPMETAVAILNSDVNPEAQLQAMQERFDVYLKEQEQKAADEQKRATEIRRDKDKAEAEARTCRASDWGLLSGWQRGFALLALTVAKRDPVLADEIRAILGMNLSGSDAAFPRSPEWFSGLNLDTLDGATRAGLAGTAQSEKDAAVLASCPPQTLGQIRLMVGGDDHACAQQWRLISESRRREAESQVRAEAGEQARVATRDQVAADRAMPRRLDRDSLAQLAGQSGKGA